MSKIALIETLDKEQLRKCVAKKADMIIANHVVIPPEDIPSGIDIFNAVGENFNNISWEVNNRNKSFLSALKKKYADLFSYKGYDITQAYLKLLIWAKYRRQHTLLAALSYLQKKEPELEVVVRSGLPSLKEKFSTYLKYFVTLFKAPAIQYPDYQADNLQLEEASYVFILQDEFIASIWQNLINQFHPRDIFLIIFSDKHTKQKIFQSPAFRDWQSRGVRSVWIDEKKMSKKSFVYIPFYKLSTDQIDYVNTLWELRSRICGFLDFFQEIFKTIQPKVVIGNAFENQYYGNLTWELGQKLNFKVVNLMNGNKIAGANNADVQFDKWLVWDEPLRQLLINQCFLDENMIHNAEGHLCQDFIQSHTYQGTLDDLIDETENRQVILYCSTMGSPVYKIRSLNTLYGLLKKRKDLMLIYRPHRRETDDEFHLPSDPDVRSRVKLALHTKTTNKQTLYDQFLKSDLVVFLGGSTTGLEAMWAGIPGISYEELDIPSMYAIDNERLFFANSPEKLVNLAEEIIQKQLKSKLKKSKVGVVSEKFARLISDLSSEKVSDSKSGNQVLT